MAYELDEALSNIDIEDWLSFEGIEYRMARGSSGEQANVKTCPSCGKDEWKVYLNAETGLGNCFSGSCPKGTFNKYSFIREYLLNYSDSVDMRGYIRSVAMEMGWKPKRRSEIVVERSNSELKLPEFRLIPINGKNLKYLANRGVTVEVAQYFNLGYVSTGYFEKRVLIPIYDIRGSLVSFQARDITGGAEKKYLFPAGFGSTGKILYNGQNSIGKSTAVLVEGVFDVIGVKTSFDQDNALRNVAILGSFGMNLSGRAQSGEDDQLSRFIELKKAGLESVTIMWDGEAAAIMKAVAAGLVLRSIGLGVRLAVLPMGSDPSDIAPDLLRHCYYKARQLTQAYAMEVKIKRGIIT